MPPADPGHWLVVGDAPLAEEVRTAGGRVTTCAAFGDVPEHFDGADDPSVVVVTLAAPDVGGDVVDGAAACVHEALALAQAWIGDDRLDPARLDPESPLVGRYHAASVADEADFVVRTVD